MGAGFSAKADDPMTVLAIGNRGAGLWCMTPHLNGLITLTNVQTTTKMIDAQNT